MKRITLAILAALAVSVSAKEFPLAVQKGGAEIVKSETGEQKIVSGNATVASKDMITLTDAQQVAITIEANGVILLKGPASATITENGGSLVVTLDDGQLLLNRKQPYEYSGLSIISKGFSFIPMGTCAAVKTTANAQPTAAVLEGKVRMQTPGGEAVVVNEGMYGSVGADGKLAAGELSPRAIESLNEWRAEGPALDVDKKSAAAAPAKPAATVAAAPAPTAPQPASTASPAVQSAPPAPAATTTTPAPAAAVPAEAAEREAAAEAAPAASTVQKVEKTPPPPSSAKWEISAGSATINDEQWTRIALGVDVPIWKFGIFFDVELFVDNNGQFSDKGWNFEDDWAEALSRKIRYIRFGQEGDPLFIKFGGLSSVTMGYGFLVDRFTNMLHYPDQKLLGLQFDLNDLSPIGLSLQTLIADFKDFDNDGGLAAARLGFRPLKPTGIPIIKGITISGSYARDLNQYAPARKWDYTMNGQNDDVDQDGMRDSGWVREFHAITNPSFTSQNRESYIQAGQYDTIIEHQDEWASRQEDPFGLIGGDISIPLITTSLVGLDLYGQAGMRDDGTHGWGIGAPGISLKVWRLWANVEYRRIQGRFQPGYFGTYYLDERLLRSPTITTKEDRLMSDTLNGVFGRLGFNISDVLLIEGSYQYMVGNDKNNKDQRFEASGALGDIILQKIPKLNKAEIYLYKSRIGNEGDNFFQETPFLYYGYRAGFAISAGATLIWDARYGYEYNKDGTLTPNNNVIVQTAITF